MASLTEKRFLDEYMQAMDDGACGVFAGAGISVPAGFPDWKTLLKEIAQELSLDVGLEADLAGVAQYHLNRSGMTRTRITQVVKDAFPEKETAPLVHRVIARMPVRHIWTTNFDTLFETAFREEHKRIDVKLSDKDLTSTERNADAILYKMHGCRSQPSSVVIAKDDFELYRRRSTGMLERLKSDVVARSLLFLGLSFSDPNLGHVLGWVREVFDRDPRRHYALIRKPHRNDYKAGSQGDAEWSYASNRFGLWIEDLQRYGIDTLVLDEYADVERVLLRLERRMLCRSVLVSGAMPNEPRPSEPYDWVPAFARRVGRDLIRANRNLVSGFGLVVGSHCIMGALEEVYSKRPHDDIGRRVLLRPFPQAPPEGMNLDTFKNQYRQDLVTDAGIVIAIHGVKDGAPSPGVLEECRIARETGRIVIPVGASGGAAEVEWNTAKLDLAAYFRLTDTTAIDGPFATLGDKSAGPDALHAAIRELLPKLESAVALK